MNKQSVGYRFRPTDEEILTYFLEGKMSGYEFPEHPIFEIDFRKCNPWQLPQMWALPDDQVWYFFSAPSYKYPNSNSKRTDRTTSDGYWKVTGKDRVIMTKYNKEVIGMKKTLVFYKGRSPNTERTNWVMHEFHSINAHLYPEEFVFCRVTRKDDDNSDASQAELSSLLPSTSGTPAADNIFSQVNHQPHVEPESYDCDLDYVILHQQMQTGEGPSHANGSNTEPNLLDNPLGKRDHEDDFVNEYEFVDSLLVDNVEFCEETVHATPLSFTPTKPLRGQMFAGDSSKSVTEFAHVLRTPSLCKGKTILKESQQMQTVHSPTITQNLPKSHNFEKECTPKRLQLQGKVSLKAVSGDKARDAEQAIDLSQKEDSIVKVGKDQKMVQTTYSKPNLKLKSTVSASDAKQAIDLPRKENSILRLDKDQKMVQTTLAKINLNSKSSVSDGNSGKNSSIFPENSPLRNKQNPPLGYNGSVDISAILLAMIICELASLH